MLMVGARGPGRPLAEGPRYDCGRRKPDPNARGEQIWQRIRDDAIAMGLDRRAGSQLSRLSLIGELTDTQIVAGFEVGRIYANFEKWHGRTRVTHKPGYVRWVATPDEALGPVRRADPDGERSTQAMRRADRAMAKLQECIAILPPRVVDVVRGDLEKLCVDDRPIAAKALDLVAPLLDYIAVQFQLTATGRLPKAIPAALTMRARQAVQTRVRPARARRTDLDKPSWLRVTQQLRPDLDMAGLEKAWAVYVALKERDRFRRQKR